MDEKISSEWPKVLTVVTDRGGATRLRHATTFGTAATLGGCLWNGESESSLSLGLERVRRDELGRKRVIDASRLESWPRAVLDAGRERFDPRVVHGDDASAFRPDPRFRYETSGEEKYYRLQSTERTVSLDPYRYGFDPVAENRSTFADYVARERVAVDFDAMNLPSNNREVLRTGAEEGVYEESPPPYSTVPRSLVDRVEGASGGARAVYVRFDGRYSLASVQQFWNGYPG